MKLAPKRARIMTGKVTSTLGAGVENVVSRHHRRRLRRVGWEHAFDAKGFGYARDGQFEGSEIPRDLRRHSL